MPRFLTDLWFRIKALVGRSAADRDLDDEFAFHIAMDADALRARGLGPDAAEREARRRFGSLTRESERTREGWGITLASEFIADVRHAFRQMRRRPAFSALAVLTLGLGLGTTVALFSVVNGILLRPLPYSDESRIRVFWMDYDWNGSEYDFVRERHGVFESVAAYSTDGQPFHASTSGSGGAQLLSFVVGTSTLADVLGTRPLLGRWFTADEDRPDAPPVIVINYDTWQRDLGGDPNVIGHQILLAGKAVTVIGVMPRGFYFPTPQMQAWVPIRFDRSTDFFKNVGYLVLVARVRPGVADDLVQKDVRQLGASLGAEFHYPISFDKSRAPTTSSVRTYLVGNVHDPLILLLSAVGLLLLIACANTAALVLARTSDRSAEMSVRLAMGAGRWRLVRQIAAESLVLAVCAAAIGGALASAGFRVLVNSLPLQNGFGDLLTPGWILFGAAAVLALLIAVVVSIAPAQNLLRGHFAAGVNRERSEEGLRRGTRRIHNAIVATQVTLAVLLVVGASLLIRSVDRLESIDPGFDPHDVETFTLVTGNNESLSAYRQFLRDALARLSALPGVTAVGMTNRLPVRDGGYQGGVTIEGRPDLAGTKRPNSLYRTATPDFVRAMGMRIVQGRGIDSTDVETSEPVTLISESFARKMWPGQDALGKHVTTAWTGTPIARRVVGIVKETRMTNMTGDIPLTMFVPLVQSSTGVYGEELVVRARGSLAALVPAVRRVISELDPEIAVARVSTMQDVVNGALAQPLQLRFFLTVFGVLALVLGAVGVYGVVTYAVARRRAEFGIRLALGATPQRVLANVVGGGLAPVAFGIVFGLAGALASGRLLARFLYGIAPTDAMSYASAALSLLVAAALAALLPAIRAGRTSPVESLRAE